MVSSIVNSKEHICTALQIQDKQAKIKTKFQVVDVAVVKQSALGSSKLVFLLAAPFFSVFTSTFLHLLNLIPSSPVNLCKFEDPS
uniref:Uncharacterized protein n=1 Tax=Gossypium raimondii TaxID=29730 RepID=A0A0D2MX71_GOSRA|nr:hypothetical protein B456_004G121200 [Gossypium raimondii]